MQKKFSFKNNRLAKTIVFSGTVLDYCRIYYNAI